MRLACWGRPTGLSQGKSMFSTSRYKNRMALSAWLAPVVRGGRYPALVGHHRQKRLNVVRAHVSRMAHAARLGSAPADEKAEPIQVGLFRLQAIVNVPNPLAHLIGQARRLQWRRTGFHGKFISVYLSKISTAKPADKRGTEFSPKRCIGTRRVYRPGLPGCITLGVIGSTHAQQTRCDYLGVL